jgi:hypothetical protein
VGAESFHDVGQTDGYGEAIRKSLFAILRMFLERGKSPQIPTYCPGNPNVFIPNI